MVGYMQNSRNKVENKIISKYHNRTLYQLLILVSFILVISPLYVYAQVVDFDDPYFDNNCREIKEHAQTADIIIVGTIITRGSPPPAFSGYATFRQDITYNINSSGDILKGASLLNTPPIVIDVGHLVVALSRHASLTAPELSNTIFYVGNSIIVFIYTGTIESTGEKIYFDFGENLGTIPASVQNINAIQEILGGTPCP